MAGTDQYNFISYKEASKFCIRMKVKNRNDYRSLRKTSSYANLNLPSNPPECTSWKGEFTNWDNFLRNDKIIPQLAAHINNHYYLFEESVYHHTAEGFIKLASRLMSNNKYYTEIRHLDGTKQNIIVNTP